MASAAAADDQPLGLLSGVWSRLRAAASVWRRRGENEGEEAITRSRLARGRLGRKLAFVSFNLEVLVFIYAFWRTRRRILNWRQPIQALPMLVIPALATLIYAAFVRFTRTLDHKDNKIIQRLQEEKQASDGGLRGFDQDEENSAKKYDWTDDPSNFSSAVASAETSKLGISPQPGIDLRDNGEGDMAWDHNKDFQPMDSVEKTCMTSSSAVIQPIDCLSEHLTDYPEHLNDTPRNVGHHCNSGTDVVENSMAYTSADTGTCLLECNIVQITSNTVDHVECSSPMNNPKCNGGAIGENSVRNALTGPMTDLPAFAESLDLRIQEIKSSKFLVSEENGMSSISKTECLVGSYTVKSLEQNSGTSGFSLGSQDNEKEDADEGVCFVRISPDLTLLSSPELVVEGSKYASKNESCELNTQYENDVVDLEEAFVVSTDKQFSGTPGFFLHAEDSNMMETPAVVDIVAISPEPNYPAPMESLTHAPDGGDFKGDETSVVHILEHKGEEVFLDSLGVDSYDDSLATSKLLSHSEAPTMTKVLGEDISESLDKGASNHQNDVPVSSYHGSNTDNMICDSMSVQLITESNIMEALQGDQEILSDPVHQGSSHSAEISLSSIKANNDEAYSSKSRSYFLYASSVEDEALLAGHAGCSESKDGMNFAFLDTPILLNEVASAESWIDNAGCSQYIQDNASTKSFHDGNQVQTDISERDNSGLEKSLISLEEGIKSEIFSLYSRSSSCVSDVNMAETLDVIEFPKPKNDNNFSIDERNLMMVQNMFHANSHTTNSRSSEFIADVNMTENHNVDKGAGAGSLHDVSSSFVNSFRAADVTCGMAETDNFLDLLSPSFVPEVDAFEGLQGGQRFIEQCKNDFAFHKIEVLPQEHANCSVPSPPMPDENSIQIPGEVQEGSFEINYEYPCGFEETSTSGDYSYNNTMSASHARMKASIRSSRKELPDLVLEDVDKFDEIAGDEMSIMLQSENELSCEQIAITQAGTHYIKIQDCTEASNVDSTKASESVTEGLFKTEHHRGLEIVLRQVGIPFIGEGKETEKECGSSNTVSSHREIRILETHQELPIAAGMEKGLLEDRNICECSCIDKEPKDLLINDIENDVEDLDEDHKRNPIDSRSS